MRIGIYTHYAHCDQAYLAVRLAELCRQAGVEFDIYSAIEPAKLGSPYDKLVLTRQMTKFTDWVKKHKVILWTHVPRIEQLKCADRAGVKTVVAPMWQELVAPFRKALRAADVVVALCAEQTELFRDIYNLRNVVCIPFDPGLPTTRKTALTDPRNVRVLLPWFDRTARCTGNEFLSGLHQVVGSMPDLRLTVAITPSRFAPSIVQFFKNLREKTAGRVTITRHTPLKSRPLLFGSHDLTLSPGECDNYGLIPLTSIYMGTPVLATGVSPQRDIIENGQNGLLIRTKADYDEHGVVHALPDYALLIGALQDFVAEPRHIDTLNKHVSKGLPQRRRAFDAGWRQILNLS